jgi:hypothetical protein
MVEAEPSRRPPLLISAHPRRSVILPSKTNPDHILSFQGNSRSTPLSSVSSERAVSDSSLVQVAVSDAKHGPDLVYA